MALNVLKTKCEDYTKKFVKENTPLIWSILKKLKDQLLILLRLKDVFMMMILFHIWPKQTYRFSTREITSLVKKYRHSMDKKTIPPYQIIAPKTEMSKNEGNKYCWRKPKF